MFIMNPMLKIAYNYGSNKCLSDMGLAKQAEYGDELSDSPYGLGLGTLGMLGGGAGGYIGLGGLRSKTLGAMTAGALGMLSGGVIGMNAGEAIDRHNYNAQLLSRLRQSLGIEEEA